MNLTIEQTKGLAELLMGAAYADGVYDGHEAEAIGDILRGLFPHEELPVEVTSHLATFDIDDFDLTNTCASMEPLGEEAKHKLLGLLSRVTDADGVHDLAETEYLHEVAQAFGLDEDEYDHHTIELIEIGTPPPIPEKS